MHKTSCKDIKLSRVYNINVKNTLPTYWHCERQRGNRKTSCYNTNLEYIYLFATPVINIYCRLKEGASPLNETFTFYKNINRFKTYVSLILFQFLFCNFIFINPGCHIHSCTIRKRLYDVGISAIDRFTYQHGQCTWQTS